MKYIWSINIPDEHLMSTDLTFSGNDTVWVVRRADAEQRLRKFALLFARIQSLWILVFTLCFIIERFVCAKGQFYSIKSVCAHSNEYKFLFLRYEHKWTCSSIQPNWVDGATSIDPLLLIMHIRCRNWIHIFWEHHLKASNWHSHIYRYGPIYCVWKIVYWNSCWIICMFHDQWLEFFWPQFNITKHTAYITNKQYDCAFQDASFSFIIVYWSSHLCSLFTLHAVVFVISFSFFFSRSQNRNTGISITKSVLIKLDLETLTSFCEA